MKLSDLNLLCLVPGGPKSDNFSLPGFFMGWSQGKRNTRSLKNRARMYVGYLAASIPVHPTLRAIGAKLKARIIQVAPGRQEQTPKPTFTGRPVQCGAQACSRLRVKSRPTFTGGHKCESTGWTVRNKVPGPPPNTTPDQGDFYRSRVMMKRERKIEATIASSRDKSPSNRASTSLKSLCARVVERLWRTNAKLKA